MTPHRSIRHAVVVHLLGWAILAGPGGLVGARGESIAPALRARFEQEYGPAVERLKQAVARVRVRGERTMTDFRGANVDRVEFFRDGKQTLAIARRSQALKSPAHDVDGLALYYAGDATYDLEYRAEGGGPDDGAWAVRDAGRRPEQLERGQFESDLTIDSFLDAAFKACHYPLDEARRQGAFRLEGLRALPGVPERVELRFSHDKHDQPWYFKGYGGGRIVLRPDLDWAIVEYQLDMRPEENGGSQGFFEGKSEFRRQDGKVVPQVVRGTSGSISEGKRSVGESNCTFEDFNFDPIDPARFSMASFGLPDLLAEDASAPAPSLFGNWLFWVCLAVLLAAAAVVLPRRLRRSS